MTAPLKMWKTASAFPRLTVLRTPPDPAPPAPGIRRRSTQLCSFFPSAFSLSDGCRLSGTPHSQGSGPADDLLSCAHRPCVRCAPSLPARHDCSSRCCTQRSAKNSARSCGGAGVHCQPSGHGKNSYKENEKDMGIHQRLGIAQAVMEDPGLLILDEPLNGLDEQGVEDIRALLLELRDQGKTILLSSHNREDIDLLCDSVCKMAGGVLTKA